MLGAWIEEAFAVSPVVVSLSRSLCWERGLKTSVLIVVNPLDYCRSLCWERGLKIFAHRQPLRLKPRRSLCWERGLKTSVLIVVNALDYCRSLCWERGLKRLLLCLL